MSASVYQSERLPCPSCGSAESRAKESRPLNDHTARRRYICAVCDTRYNIRVATRFWYEDGGKKLIKSEIMTYIQSRKKTVLKPPAIQPIGESLTQWVSPQVTGVAM